MMDQALDQASLGVGWTNPSETYAQSKWANFFPNFRGEHKKSLKFHPLDQHLFWRIFWGQLFPLGESHTVTQEAIFPLKSGGGSPLRSIGSNIFFLYMSIIPVGGWTNPFEKYDRQIGPFPQGSGWTNNIFEITTWHVSIETLGCDKKFIIRI